MSVELYILFETVLNLYNFAYEGIAGIFLFILGPRGYGYAPSSQTKIRPTILLKIRII